jgi:hemolysin activation/secretion protein
VAALLSAALIGSGSAARAAPQATPASAAAPTAPTPTPVPTPGSAAPTGAAPAPSPPAAPSPAPAAAAAAAANVFDIHEFRVLGNHVLAPTAIEHAVYPFLGPGRSIDTVKHAADALEQAYKSAGYNAIFVDIPEQEVQEGVVRLKVTEGALDEVHVRGERYFSGRSIVAALPALQQGRTPNFPEFQKELTALNARTPDRVTTPVLKAGPQPGTVDVELDVKDTLPLHGSIQYDDRHTADTTPNRATVGLSYDNLWQRQDSIGLQYQTAPAKPSDAEVLMANYGAHIGPTGEATVSYTHTSSNVLALGTLGVLGKGSIYGLHWSQPLPGASGSSQSLNFGADYKDVLTSVLPNASAAASTAVTAQVRYVNWSGTYAGAWWLDKQFYSVSAGANFGVRGVINSSDEFENARYNANPDYFYLRFSFNGSQQLPWSFAFTQKLSGQWSDSPLVNNEQYSLGGEDTVRGYLEAETLGDSGFASSLELHGPPVGPHLGSWLSPIYGFAFVDAGLANLVDPLSGQHTNLSLWSTGVGLRLEGSHGLSGYVDYAIPRRAGVRTERDHSRIDFLLRYGF